QEIVDSTPRFIGTAAPESIIYAWDAGNLLGSTVSDEDGNWSFETNLEDGQHALTFGVYENDTTLPFGFIVNSAAAIPVQVQEGYTDNLGYDIGIWPGQEIVDNTPRFIGTAAPEAIIYAWDHGVLLGSTVSELDGTWSFTIPELASGEHALTFGSEAEFASQPLHFSVQDAVMLPASATITDILIASDSWLLSVNEIDVEDDAPNISLTQQDLSVESINGVNGTLVMFSTALEDHYA
ncbi:Ig-like domain-containing protein, partial [Pantoea sp.]|uniref:Ig-like domain-containing protein n=1 Tax=Pantoea sp. TaxID=69393 RepID=UPI0031DB0F71